MSSNDGTTPAERLETEVGRLKGNLDRLDTSLKALMIDLNEARRDLETVERVFVDMKQTFSRRINRISLDE